MNEASFMITVLISRRLEDTSFHLIITLTSERCFVSISTRLEFFTGSLGSSQGALLAVIWSSVGLAEAIGVKWKAREITPARGGVQREISHNLPRALDFAGED